MTWFVNKYWLDEFINRNDIKDVLIKAKLAERDRLLKVFEEEKQKLIRRMEIEKELAVEELKAQIVMMQADFDNLENQAKVIEEVYIKSVRRSKVNARVATDMALQAQNLLELAAKIHGAIEGIKIRALNHLKTVEIEDNEEKGKLISFSRKRYGG